MARAEASKWFSTATPYGGGDQELGHSVFDNDYEFIICF